MLLNTNERLRAYGRPAVTRVMFFRSINCLLIFNELRSSFLYLFCRYDFRMNAPYLIIRMTLARVRTVGGHARRSSEEEQRS
jgi:hypothetical protein